MNTLRAFDRVFTLEVAIASAVFALITGCLTFAVVRYRAGRSHEPSAATKHTRLEVTWASVVATVAVLLVVFTATANASERKPLSPIQLRVGITAYRWCWAFNYPGLDVSVTGDCQTGSWPTLVLPEDRNIQFALTSDDVVHEWWVPYTGFKEEAFPGHFNYFDMRFDTVGSWPGRCSEYCGLYHDEMDFTLKVVPARTFLDWLRRERLHGGTDLAPQSSVNR